MSATHAPGPALATTAPDGAARVPGRRPRAGAVRGGFCLPAPLTCEQVAQLGDGPVPLRLHDGVDDELRACRDGLERLLAAGTPVYGATTGFGPHVVHPADPDPLRQGAQLVAHLASGAGDWAPAPVVRAMLVVRASALARARSGVTPGTLRALCALAASPLVPAVPLLGSVGASGDLVPLAHVARVLTGEGLVLDARAPGGAAPAAAALAAHGLAPVPLDARDALALVNGTAYSTAWAALAVARAERVWRCAVDLTGWLHACLGANDQALDARLHEARNQPGQVHAAALVRGAAARSGAHLPVGPRRALQEVYSVRCAPQVLGPAQALVAQARAFVEAELQGVSDNPVVVPAPGTPHGWEALHGGNFHAAAVGTAADLLTGALTQVTVLAERQVEVLCRPETSLAPLLLASVPGAQAGLAGAQLTASALVAEARHACQWSSTMSVPTNAGNQDVVPMAPLGARTAWAQTTRAATVLGVLAVALGQYTHLVRRGLADGRAATPPPWLDDPGGFDHDVPTLDPVRHAAACVLGEPPAPH